MKLLELLFASHYLENSFVYDYRHFDVVIVIVHSPTYVKLIKYFKMAHINSKKHATVYSYIVYVI